MFNKKATVGETITWVIATVIIIVILLISVFVTTSFLSGNKKVDFSAKQSDFLALESFFAYLLTEDTSGQTIYEQLKEEGNLTQFNGELALNIFNGLYSEDYWLIWFVIYSKPNNIIHNKYFPKPPPCGRGIWDEIELNKNKYILLALTKNC